MRSVNMGCARLGPAGARAQAEKPVPRLVPRLEKNHYILNTLCAISSDVAYYPVLGLECSGRAPAFLKSWRRHCVEISFLTPLVRITMYFCSTCQKLCQFLKTYGGVCNFVTYVLGGARNCDSL